MLDSAFVTHEVLEVHGLNLTKMVSSNWILVISLQDQGLIMFYTFHDVLENELFIPLREFASVIFDSR